MRLPNAQVAELADAVALGATACGRVSSNLTLGTTIYGGLAEWIKAAVLKTAGA